MVLRNKHAYGQSELTKSVHVLARRFNPVSPLFKMPRTKLLKHVNQSWEKEISDADRASLDVGTGNGFLADPRLSSAPLIDYLKLLKHKKAVFPPIIHFRGVEI